MSVSISSFEGRKLTAKIRKMSLKAKERTKAVIAVTAQEIVTNAKLNLQTTTSNPNVDLTTIRQSINAAKVNDYNWKIQVNALPMAAYIEFGSGTYVEVAPEWRNMAWEFYVNGKGTMKPKPYLWPAYQNGKMRMVIDLQRALK